MDKNTELKKKIQEYWTKNVPGWDVISKEYDPKQREFYTAADNLRYQYDSYIPALLESFVHEGELLLEIGCGLGSDTRFIAKKKSNIISLDLSFNNVYLTKMGSKLLGIDNNRGVCADGENLPFKDNSFDKVYSFGVLHHTPNTGRAINDIYRILKPNGRCLVMLYHKGYAYYFLLLRYFHLFIGSKFKRCSDGLLSNYDHTPLSRLYSKEEIKDLFSKFNNIEIEITTYGGIQRHRLLKYIYNLLNKNFFLMNRLGSFAVIKAKK